jgi:hypothetical protein
MRDTVLYVVRVAAVPSGAAAGFFVGAPFVGAPYGGAAALLGILVGGGLAFLGLWIAENLG